ncbi:MAG: MATE family efflux transporter [Schleiferiaceae bacterium]|nr:MATE family efflux transporter [Schleiferiaceae bacterium]
MKWQLAHKEQYRKNFNLAYPVMIGSLGQNLVMLADSIMVGQTGHIPLAAVSLSNSLFFAPTVFGMGIAYGITPLVANAEGAGESEKSVRVLKNGLLIAVGAALFLGLAVFGLAQVMELMGQEPEVTRAAKPYLYILIASILPFMLFMAMKQFAEGLLDTKAAMRVSITANVINVVLNYVLIFGKLGFPELGLIGAGYATLISRIFQAIAMAGYLWYLPKFDSYKTLWKTTVIKFRYLKDVLKIGVPTGLQSIFEVSAFAMAAIIIGTIGAKEQAAHQIAISLASMSYMLAHGMAAAATIRVSNQLGMRDYPQLKLAMRTIFRMIVWMSIFFGLAFVALRYFLPGLFTQDAEVIQIASVLLVVTAFFQLSDGVQVVALGALRGFSDVKIPTWITLMAYWAIALPLGFVLGKYTSLGPTGVWLGLALGLSVAAALLWHRYTVKAAALR